MYFLNQTVWLLIFVLFIPLIITTMITLRFYFNLMLIDYH
ncbi:hypothetical protein HMPREF0758_2261 [Serratia odorifera DSM 4582]|uniref:Uncharacterized protein n=1 Tax=Serratia odorifera DSM 4582 TaxID=667129 RepID=D4E261_SEROD|nr:hypothetical protein HMPREF0758_2261 [Serratia odorifera DSM 4582]